MSNMQVGNGSGIKQVTAVSEKWSCPYEGWLNINCDGAFCGCQGKPGGLVDDIGGIKANSAIVASNYSIENVH